MRNPYEKSCPLSHEIVSYVYGEIAGDAEVDFERHLADCTVCTDEFAAVSESRYSLFEWKKEAFDPLSTPEIVIPYADEVLAGAWSARIRKWAETFSVPVAVAAALAVCVAIAGFLLSRSDNNEQSSAINVTAPAPNEPSDVAVTEMRSREQEPERNETARPLNRRGSSVPQRKQVIRRSPADAERRANNFAITPNRSTRVPKVPALSQYPDNADNSLRLAELFDEVGG